MRIYQNLADASWFEKFIYYFDLVSHFAGYLISGLVILAWLYIFISDTRKNK